MNKTIIKLFITIILFIFITSYLIANSGYYEYSLKQNMIITNEKIKEFEQDIKNDKDVTLIDYLNKDKKNYTNKFSNTLYSISTKSNKLTKKLFKKIFKSVSKLIEE